MLAPASRKREGEASFTAEVEAVLCVEERGHDGAKVGRLLCQFVALCVVS